MVLGTFDSFNPYIVQGSPAAGLVGFGGGLLYDTLMEQATDEGSTSHPLIADAYKYPDDYSSATYRLDPRAKWHDGQPITVDDVIWSFQVLKANSPQYSRYFENVTDAVAVSDREVEFRFNQKGNRELPKIIGDLVVLPKHWWEGTDANGKKRDITKPTLEPPLGSAAYKIASFKPGSEIVWQRVPDYWAAKLPVKIGRENFDTQRYTYILDDNAAWQAFTKGGLDDIKPENSSQRWATATISRQSRPATSSSRNSRRHPPEPMQGFVLNQRRPLFQDRLVREALTYPFDFESMNRTLFFGFNTRTDSYFQGTELASSGLPQGKELEILEQYRDKLPPELFTQEFKLPVYDSPQAERKYLQAGGRSLRRGRLGDQGRQDGQRQDRRAVQVRNSSAERHRPESSPVPISPICARSASTPRCASSTRPSISTASTISISTSSRRLFGQSDSPGNEQRDFWSSKAADTPGSRNLMGIKDPVVDALVDRIIFATDRDDLVAATHALDRVLLWNFYVVPQYYRAVVWLAYWNKFGIPEKQPAYVGVDIDSWWIDLDKEKALAAKYKGSN